MILYKRTWKILKIFIFIFILVSVSNAFAGNGLRDMSVSAGDQDKAKDSNSSDILNKLNSDLQSEIVKNDIINARLTVNSILKLIENIDVDRLVRSNSCFYVGSFYNIEGKYTEAISRLKEAISIREQLDCLDGIYFKSLNNLGVAYYNLGDFKSMEKTYQSSLKIKTKLLGNSNPSLFKDLSYLVIAYLDLKEYDKAISMGNEAIRLINSYEHDNSLLIASLYINIGVCHSNLSDYSKAVLFFEKAELIFKQHSLTKDEKYINLLNNIAVSYYFLGQNDKSEEYFNKGIEISESNNSFLSLNFINSFAITLGKSGKIENGEALIANSLNKAKKIYGTDSDAYIEVLKNYAEYLREFDSDLKKSLLLYKQCMAYLDRHKESVALNDQIVLGYAITLSKIGETVKALELIQKLLFSHISVKPMNLLTGNPDIDQIESDQWSLNVLKAKYDIVRDLYRKSGENEYLFATAGTSELIVALLEKIRINISEEDSRLVLGDRYRDFYLCAIHDLNLCYKATGDKGYLEKAFEYSEKSKVAGLLASTRELKATQFNVPQAIGDLEKKLQTEIGSYNARIVEENCSKSPNAKLVSDLKGLVFKASQSRDSLVNLFEKQYPDYYHIKYNTRVVKPYDIPGIVGRNTNYINYVAGDTVLYIFLTNRKYNKLITIQIDSSFYSNIRKFRNMLSSPPIQNDAKAEYNRYMKTGNYICRTIFDPVREFLISDKILISPDNIISYIPFEAIPSSIISSDKIAYKDVPYLMNDFSISYTYSATFLAETARNELGFSNSVVAFAPVYTHTINIDSLLVERQTSMYGLQDLPYARMEAKYVTDLTGGRLYINGSAKESVFKTESVNCDIIHLAMHTVLNDQHPMHSKMIFYQGEDSTEDGLLNTYEIYGIPLKAKMVVLSSCNTGSGLLNTGEGILSLARGFSYSGSQSVVMSMWEIEDKSGTEIIEQFYRSLKSGASKSSALRKARENYLKNADMLRSHPYFWSALVIYGSNKPLYIPGIIIIVPGILLILAIAAWFFYHRSK